MNLPELPLNQEPLIILRSKQPTSFQMKQKEDIRPT